MTTRPARPARPLATAQDTPASVVTQAATPRAPRPLDLWLLGAALCLLGGGTVIVYSSSAVFATQHNGDDLYFLKRHLMYLCMGGVAMWLGAKVHYQSWKRFAHVGLFASLGALAGVLVLGSKINGATRWFRVGPASFQPAELAKIALVIYLAYSLGKMAEKVKSFTVGFLPHLMIAGIMMGLLLMQPDLGNAVIIGATVMVLLFVAGAKVSYMLLALMAAAPVIYYAIVGTPWRMQRMLAYFDPWQHRRSGAGYQITESLISIGSGGMWGLGLGEGKQKLFFLPEAHNDFIAASLGEELGLIGLIALLLLCIAVVVRGVRAAVGARDAFGMYLAFGFTALFGMQALVNLGVVMGLLPAKGLPLPLVSYGGTSLIFYMFGLGVLLNVGTRTEPAPAALRGLRLWGPSREGMARRRRRAMGPATFSTEG